MTCAPTSLHLFRESVGLYMALCGPLPLRLPGHARQHHRHQLFSQNKKQQVQPGRQPQAANKPI